MSSVDVDLVMVLEDIWGSEAHVLMLCERGIIGKADAKGILLALGKAREEYLVGKFLLDPELEDVHMNLEAYVMREAGSDVGGKMHTARSRNDQVVTDTRLHLRENILETEKLILGLQDTLLSLANENVDAVMPGYTHLQHAQPITLGFWLTSYVSMLMRDLDRLNNAYSHVNVCPLGACALAGTSFDIDRGLTAELLGFDGFQGHALDSVCSRDFIAEVFSALAILMSTLSRMAEELILWSSFEFGFLELPGEYTTGSSIMPQKRNPDYLELIRGKTGQLYGSLTHILVLLKALPSAYNRDFQEDRGQLWGSFATVNSSLSVLGEILAGSGFNRERMLELVDLNFSTATELANFLVRERGLSFREAHGVTRKAVLELIRKRKTFSDVGVVEEILDGRISAGELRDLVDGGKAIYSYRSCGSASPREVKAMIRGFGRDLKERYSDLGRRRDKIERAKKLTEKRINEIVA